MMMTQTDIPDEPCPTIPEAVEKLIMTTAEEIGLFKLLDWITKLMRAFGYA